MLHQPFTARLYVRRVFGLRGDAGEAEIIAQFVEGALAVLFEEFQNGVHADTIVGQLQFISSPGSFASIEGIV